MCGHLSELRTAEHFQFLLTAPWSSLREQGAVRCRNNKQMLTLHCADQLSITHRITILYYKCTKSSKDLGLETQLVVSRTQTIAETQSKNIPQSAVVSLRLCFISWDQGFSLCQGGTECIEVKVGIFKGVGEKKKGKNHATFFAGASHNKHILFATAIRELEHSGCSRTVCPSAATLTLCVYINFAFMCRTISIFLLSAFIPVWWTDVSASRAQQIHLIQETEIQYVYS